MNGGGIATENPKKRYRVQLDFTPDDYKKLQDLLGKAGAESVPELVKDAVRLYLWYLKKTKDDGCVVLIETPEFNTFKIELLF